MRLTRCLEIDNALCDGSQSSDSVVGRTAIATEQAEAFCAPPSFMLSLSSHVRTVILDVVPLSGPRKSRPSGGLPEARLPRRAFSRSRSHAAKGDSSAVEMATHGASLPGIGSDVSVTGPSEGNVWSRRSTLILPPLVRAIILVIANAPFCTGLVCLLTPFNVLGQSVGPLPRVLHPAGCSSAPGHIGFRGPSACVYLSRLTSVLRDMTAAMTAIPARTTSARIIHLPQPLHVQEIPPASAPGMP